MLVVAYGVAFAGVWKSVVEGLLLGDCPVLRQGSFVRWRVGRHFDPRFADVLASIHKPLIVLRLIASMAISVGIFPRVSAAVLALAMFPELYWRFRYNQVFVILCAALVAMSSCHGDFVSGLRCDGPADGPGLASVLVKVLMLDLYLASAWLKFRSADFRSGLVLRSLMAGLSDVRGSLPRWEYPAWVPRFYLAGANRFGLSRWDVPISWAVALCELILPCLLVTLGPTIGVLMFGVLFYGMLLMLAPLRLIAFQVLTLACFFVF